MSVFFLEFLAALAIGVQAFVQVEIKVLLIDDAARDVRAVVAHALQIRQQIRPHEARLDRALALLHAEDMMRIR